MLWLYLDLRRRGYDVWELSSFSDRGWHCHRVRQRQSGTAEAPPAVQALASTQGTPREMIPFPFAAGSK